MRNSPACSCCGCLIIDRTGFTEECTEGDWTDTSGYWQTDQQNAIRYTTSEAGEGEPWVVCAAFQIFWNGTGEKAVVRTIGGFADCDNYVYAEMEYKNWPGGSNNGYSVAIRIGKVIAGVDTILAEHPYDDTKWSSTGDMTGIWWGELRLCWDGVDFLTAMLRLAYRSPKHRNPTTPLVAVHDVTLPGLMAGFGVGELSNVTKVRFDYTARYELGRTEELTQCPNCQDSCCDGITPPEVQVQIADSDPYAYVSWSCGGVDFRLDCAQIVGTFIAPKYVNDLVFNVHTRWDGDANCYWRYEWEADAEYYQDGYWNAIGITLQIDVRVELNTSGPPVRYLTVVVSRAESDGNNCTSSTNATLAVFRKDVDILPSTQCADWTSLFYVPPSPTVPGATFCQTGGGITCQIKMLP